MIPRKTSLNILCSCLPGKNTTLAALSLIKEFISKRTFTNLPFPLLARRGNKKAPPLDRGGRVGWIFNVRLLPFWLVTD